MQSIRGIDQKKIERVGIATIGISIVREYSEKVRPPRTLFLRWPFGHPVGEPNNRPQQRAVLFEAFRALYQIKQAGTIVDLPFRWHREQYLDYEPPTTAELGG